MKNIELLSTKIRKNILKITYSSKSAHIASSLSIVDIIATIYSKFLKKNKKNIFVLSKGHACLAHYCLLYEFGYIKKKTLNTFGKNGTILMSHSSHMVPGVNLSTGSLGHGLPVSTGIALSKKITSDDGKVFVLLSDGELNEGSNWESLLFSAHNNLNNLVIIIDHNKIQSLDFVNKTMKLDPLKKKFSSFGCKVLEINGHNHKEIFNSLKSTSNKPLVVIANTIKGKGISFMENKVLWHYKSPNFDELILGLKELKK